MNERPPQFSPPPQTKTYSGPAPRPRDAATLIIVQKEGAHVRVLMGQRHAKHSFMPNKYVFPGGRVSLADSRITPHTDLLDKTERQLRYKSNRKNVRSLALAAVRETFEETGLLLGTRSRPLSGPTTSSKSPEWRPFFEAGVFPKLDALDLLARAITPTYRPKRFDARFFIADASLIQNDLNDTSKASGELINLKWVTLEEALGLELPNVTQAVLHIIRNRLVDGVIEPPTFFRTVNNKHMSESIDID